MDAIVIDIDTGEAQAFLEFAGYRAKSVGVPLRRCARNLLESIDQTFESEGAWVNEYWPDLNPKYESWKERNAPTIKGQTMKLHFTVNESGSLRREATDPLTIDISEFDGEGGEMTYTLEEPFYGEVHQHGAEWTGSDGKPRRIPPRKWLVVDSDLVQEFEDIFEDWLVGRRAQTAKGDSFASIPLPYIATVTP